MVSQKKVAKAKTIDDQELIARTSKAVVTELSSYYTTQHGKNTIEQMPTYNLSQVLSMARQDSIIWGGVTTLLDKIFENGWEVVDSKTQERLPATESLLKNKGLDAWQREIGMHFVLFQNAFGELVYTPSRDRVKELHTLDPTKTKIEVDEHGEIKSFYQEVHSQPIKWEPEEVIHVRDAGIEQNAWGETSVRSIYQAVALKYHIKKFMLWLFETNQFRGIYNPKSGDTESIKRFISFMKESERDINKPVIIEGEFTYQVMRDFAELKSMNDLLYKMDEEILNYLQVPPIYAGLPDNSNRGNSDAQERAFNTRVKSVQQVLAAAMNDLLKRMGIFKSTFRYKPLSIKTEREVFENAMNLKQMGLKGEVIADYMRNHGIDLPKGDIFEPVPDMTPQQGGVVDEKFYPSRKRKATGEGNQKIGTGERGTTREDQLVSRAWVSDFLVEE